MKKYTSQISVALVCCILGFMLAYQFKILNNQAKVFKAPETNSDITIEIEQYKKQKEQMQKNIDDLQGKLKSYEEAAANKNDESKALLEELETTRLLTGTKDVQGPGVVVYLTPNKSILGSDLQAERITDKHLVYIVNDLIAGGAEAVSINDIRITPRTGIVVSGSDIRINGEKVSPMDRITIKAIGDKDVLYSVFTFPGALNEFKTVSKITYEKSDNITIKKYNKSFKFEYAKPVKQK
ncbi:DUF881 domain-containing protein [Clostridium swellfunianum]|uniref:DUF881 domain-containing protein n=1 Tax=Clostridium swellfunianum TaxID=1367462 RepID=UPI0020302AF3|nr:DUF881 domain-containing protein [Clostridium swellfunianum]MCM0650411.1 DUF881 domain-containing protein [Clostridium swellfunianum]